MEMIMQNLIPNYIAEKFQKNIFSGEFTAVTMFLDISGFTAMTERLMLEGKEGAEILSQIINNVFEPVIAEVYDAKGFISTFAGDAFTAIFPNAENTESKINCALRINNIFKSIGRQKTKYGVFELFVKIGLSFGKAEWAIVGNESHKTFYFGGDAINACAYSEHHCEQTDIVLDEHIIKTLPQELVKDIPHNKKHIKLSDFKFEFKDAKNAAEQFEIKEISKKTLRSFMPDQAINMSQQGEFREVAAVFISFKEFSARESLNKFVSEIITVCDLQGGYFNKMDFGDKGGVILVVFGAPVSYENNLTRALNFLSQIRNAY